MTPSRPPKEYNHKSEFPQFSGQQQFQITLFRPGFGALHEQNLNYLSLHGQNSHPSFGNTDVGNVQSFGFRDKAVYSNHANHYSTNDIYTRLQMTNPVVYVNQTECFGSEAGNPKSNLSRMDEIRKGKRPIQAVDDFNPILAFNGSSTLCAAECESPSSAFVNRNQFQAMPASQQQHEDREFDEEEFDALLEQFCKIQGSLPLSRKVHPEIRHPECGEGIVDHDICNRRRKKFSSDSDSQNVFQARFGNRYYTWSFRNSKEPSFQTSSAEFEWRDRSSWTRNRRKVWDSASDINDEDDDDKSCMAGSYSDRTVLGLPPTGPLKIDAVKTAFRSSALKWHPDKHQGPS
ncbi:hypothetical protein IFM89_021941 [Coptis chinensis]|uniref:J domain-containing protein n=1 Tax=Coptis chinensis TaxID=261450 RepID=A0A835HDH6_9MAGN|nr:hypothetical protein IFM89_021941 [Coptis chinensis]